MTDPFADLAQSLEALVAAYDDAAGRRPIDPDSTAGREVSRADSPSWAVAVPAEISQETWTTITLAADAGLDHLLALAAALRDRRVVSAPYTLARGSLEAFGQAFYLSDPSISAFDRVVRFLNFRLAGLYESRRMLAGIVEGDKAGDLGVAAAAGDAGVQVAVAIEDALGRARDLDVDVISDRHGQQFIGRTPPSKMALCTQLLADAGGHGQASYRQLSSVAHTEAHGLHAHVAGVIDPVADDVHGGVRAPARVTAEAAATRLLCAPLGASAVVLRLFPMCAWELASIRAVMRSALEVWHDIAKI